LRKNSPRHSNKIKITYPTVSKIVRENITISMKDQWLRVEGSEKIIFS
jgi:hypothetical protein